MTPDQGDFVYEFGVFSFNPARRSLSAEGKAMQLGSRALDLLAVLVESAGKVVRASELMSRVWPSSVVDDAALRVHLSALRKLFRAVTPDAGAYISNVSQRGYVFVAPVQRRVIAEYRPLHEGASFINRRLPLPVTSLIGRDEVVLSLEEATLHHRCVSVVGPGGIGKTTVALAVARRIERKFPDGALFIDLSAVADPAVVPRMLGSALGASFSEGAASDQASSGLRALVILDNCEQVVRAVAAFAESLLLRVSSVHLLTTSREPLRIRGEWVHRLGGLDSTDSTNCAALQLFSDRCSLALGGYELTEEDVEAAVEICRRLDGIPLAIELAAARAGEFGIHGLRRLLDDRLELLARGFRNAPPRHQTLRATLDWSYGLLAPSEQALLCKVSAFRGLFTLEWILDVGGVGALASLSGLLAKSMIVCDLKNGGPRYRLLESTRAYVIEKLSRPIAPEQPILEREPAGDLSSAPVAAAKKESA